MDRKVLKATVTLLGDRGYPLETVSVSAEAGQLSEIENIDEIRREACKVNPEITHASIVRAIVREGVLAVAKQVKSGKLSSFLREARS